MKKAGRLILLAAMVVCALASAWGAAGTIRRTEDNSILTQMILIPRKGVIIQRVSAIHFFGSVCVQQMKHQKNIVHILLIKNSDIMKLFFVREQISNGVKDVSSLTYL